MKDFETNNINKEIVKLQDKIDELTHLIEKEKLQDKISELVFIDSTNKAL